MQIPRRWFIDDATNELEAWKERDQPTDAQTFQLYEFLFERLAVNPLNFPRANIADLDGAVEHVAQVPESRIVVAFFYDRDDWTVYITRIETSGR